MDNTDLMAHEVVDKETFFNYYKQQINYEDVDLQELHELACKLDINDND